MTAQNKEYQHIEGLILIFSGLVIYFLNFLKIIPETENVVYEELTVFDILQYLLGLMLVGALFWYWKPFAGEFRKRVQEHFGDEFNHIQSRLKLFEKTAHFFLLVIIYVLTIPDLKTVLIKSDFYSHEIILPINLIFIATGFFILSRIWRFTRESIAESMAYHNLIEETRDTHSGNSESPAFLTKTTSKDTSPKIED